MYLYIHMIIMQCKQLARDFGILGCRFRVF